jgi:glucoamylase
MFPQLCTGAYHYEFAAGRDVRKLIHTIEQFAFRGTMFPEQTWDAPDVKSAGMYFGGPAGSAMPLMWAHAEYVKLLRSVADCRVFDLIPVVAERYLNRRGRKDIGGLEAYPSSQRSDRRAGSKNPGARIIPAALD